MWTDNKVELLLNITQNIKLLINARKCHSILTEFCLRYLVLYLYSTKTVFFFFIKKELISAIKEHINRKTGNNKKRKLWLPTAVSAQCSQSAPRSETSVYKVQHDFCGSYWVGVVD